MEFPLSFTMNQFATILAFLLFVVSLSWLTRNVKRNHKKTKTAPVAGGAWPIIGHLHKFQGSKLIHRTLGEMADKFGPIFTIKLGMHPALVICSAEIARECFTTNDAALSSRPKSIAFENLSYNYASFGFGPYGPYWKYLRKVTVFHLMSNRHLEMLGQIRQEELKTYMRGLYDRWVKNKAANSSDKVLVDIKKWFGDFTLDVILRIVTGKTYTSGEEDILRFHEPLSQLFTLIGILLVADAFPMLRWLDYGGHEKTIKKAAKEIDVILQQWLDEHKQSRIAGKGKREDQDFMDMMLYVFDDATLPEECKGYDADTINKSNCMGTLAGGTDTTTVSLTWALSLLLNNPHTLKKVQEELDLRIGRERNVQASDLENLPYLQAIVKEAWRLYPPGPLLAPREALEDCTVAGYHVPKGTRLIVNAWKLQRDPKIYSNPEEFRPERYLEKHKHVEAKGQNFELIPFGSGRRVCTGATFAWHTVNFTLATLLHGFNIEVVSDEPIDMSESPGLSNLKASPLDVLLTPRLSPKFYE